MAEKDRVQVINTPNVIKSKVVEGGPGAVDEETLEKAETVITQETDNYIELAKADLKKIQVGLAKIKDSPDDPQPGMEMVFFSAHNIKGQAGSFGFELLTMIAERLCRIIEYLDEVTVKEVQVMELCVLAMQLAISQGLTGEGGEEGAALVEGLDMIVAKFFPEKLSAESGG